MDDIERICREAEIVRAYEAYSGTFQYRATRAQLAMLVHLAQLAERKAACNRVQRDLFPLNVPRGQHRFTTYFSEVEESILEGRESLDAADETHG